MSFFSFLPICIDFSLEGYKFISVGHYYVLPSLHQLRTLLLQLLHIYIYICCQSFEFVTFVLREIPSLLFVFISDFVAFFLATACQRPGSSTIPTQPKWHVEGRIINYVQNNIIIRFPFVPRNS